MNGNDVASVALRAAAAHAAGQRQLVVGPNVFNLVEKGFCARFCRQAHEAALGLKPFDWPFAAANARAMEAKLQAAHLRVDSPKPGDVAAINKGTGTYGHIAVYTGDGYICENTSGSRGPGTVRSPLSAVIARVSGYYRAAPEAPGRNPAVLHVKDHNLAYRMIGGNAYVGVRDIAAALGLALDTEDFPEITLG